MNETNQKSILLVEDEVLIALMTIQQLEKRGYHLLHAQGGEIAIELIEQNLRKIDLILMDIDLGELKDGTEIAEEISMRS